MSSRQDFTAWTETDASARITVAAESLVVAALADEETAYVTKDFGADYFAADFEVTIPFKASTGTTATDLVYIWAMANQVSQSMATAITAGTQKLLAVSFLANSTTQGGLTLREGDGTNVDTQAGTTTILTVGTQYYLRICRDESVTTFGTLYCYIYSNAAMTDLVEVISLVLDIKTDFRYMYAFSDGGLLTGAQLFSGTVGAMTLDQHPYTLEGMVGQLRTLLDEVTASYFTDPQLKLYINHAIRDIASITGCIRHIDTATVTNATRTVAFTGYTCHAVEYTPLSGSPYYLIKISPVQVSHVNANGVEPQFWYEFGSNIGIEPLPTATYASSLKLYIEDFASADMSVDTEIPQILPAFQPLIIPKALQQAFIQDNKMAAAQQMFSIYRNEMLYTMQDQLQNIPDGTLDLRFM